MTSILVDLDENKVFYNTRQLDELLQFANMWLSRDYVLRMLFGEKRGMLASLRQHDEYIMRIAKLCPIRAPTAMTNILHALSRWGGGPVWQYPFGQLGPHHIVPPRQPCRRVCLCPLRTGTRMGMIGKVNLAM